MGHASDDSTSTTPPAPSPTSAIPAASSSGLGSERTLKTSDGTVLQLVHYPAAGGAPRATLVMLHGFSVHSGRYRQIAAAFARRGLSVTAFDFRGHGRSTGRRGHVRRFSDFLDDLHAVIESAREADGAALPIILVGHSHGATVALRYALEQRTRISALVAVAPWLALRLKIPAWKLMFARIVGAVWPTIALGNELRPQNTIRDPAVLARLADDALVHHVATPRWFNEVRAAQAYLRAHAASLSVPTLVAIAGDDRIVSNQATLAFCRAAGELVQVKRYEGAYHEVLLEPEWERIVEDFASWVVARLPAPYT